MKRLLSVLLVLVTCLIAGGAAADDAADKATARELAIQGAAALEAKEYEKAADRFSRAEALFHAPTLVLGLARAQVGLGRYVEARESYRSMIREELGDEASSAFREAKASAEEELAAIEGKIAWVILRVKGPKGAADAKLDGNVLPAAALGVRRPVNPGEHRLEASAEGYASGATTFEVEPGEGREVELVLQVEKAGGGIEPSVTDENADEADGLAIAGWVTLGLGGAALIAGGVMGGLALGMHSDLSDACGETAVCPASEQDNLDDFRTFGNASTGLFVVGGVLAATGVTLLVLGLGDDGGEAADTALLFVPAAGPTGGGLFVSGAF